MKTFLDQLPKICWDDIDAVSHITENIVERLANDKDTLTYLVKQAYRDPALWDKCEIHHMDDKIVLYDDLDRGIRIRLRLARIEQYERVHNHRFSFSTYILHGGYTQRWYQYNGNINAFKADDIDKISTVCVKHETVGTSFTIHHNALHSTFTTKEAISLVIRGPKEKDRAILINMTNGDLWYRLGAEAESLQRSKEIKMDEATYHYWVQRLIALGIINDIKA